MTIYAYTKIWTGRLTKNIIISTLKQENNIF